MIRILKLSSSISILSAIICSSAIAAPNGDEFLKSAIQGDNSEIMLGQLAAAKGSTDQVRKYGQILVSDHSAAKQDAMTLAKQMNLQPSDGPKPEAAQMKDKLSGLSGADFDRTFAQAMVDDHKKDIADYKDEAGSNQGPVSAMAAKQLPVLERHLQIAQQLTGASNASKAQPAAVPAGAFLTQEGADLWRGSKLIGVNLYGPDNKKVGSIGDVLMGRDGKVTAVVVGVGGFLGIGEKNVAIPFDKVDFTQDPLPPPAGMVATPDANAPAGAGMAPNTAAGTGTATAGMAPNPLPGAGTPGDTLGTPSVPVTNNMAAAAPGVNAANQADMAMQRSTAYPDHGTVAFTADQLKAAPSFQYAK